MAYTHTDQCRVNDLNLIAGVGGVNLRLRLYKNNIIIDKNTQLNTLIEANFDGYVPLHSSIWSAPAADTADDVFILSPTLVFQKASGIVGNTIYGHYLTWDDDVNPTLLLGVEKFTTPMPMIVVSDQIPLRILFSTRNLTA